jgi:hypothetical protein
MVLDSSVRHSHAVVASSALLLLAVACNAKPDQADATDTRAVQVAAGTDLALANFIGRVERVPMTGTTISVEIVPGNADLTPSISQRGNTQVVTGPRRNNNVSCRDRDGQGTTVRIGSNTYQMADLPVLRIAAPDTVSLDVSNGIIWGDLGNIGKSSIGVQGCGPLSIGTVAGDLELSNAGSGQLTVGPVIGGLEFNLAGSGNAALGAVGGIVNLNIAGSGDTTVGAAASDVEVNVAGSGKVTVGRGEGAVEVNIAGSGDVEYLGTAINPRVSIVGSGDVRLGSVRGQPSVSRIGSGQVIVLDSANGR